MAVIDEEAIKNAARIICAQEKKFIITDEFKIIKKWGIKWILLSLVQPFYLIIGKDAFSHVRANNIAAKILKIADQQSGSLDTITKAALSRIVSKLVINNKQDLKINEIKEKLFPLVKEPDQDKEIKDGYGEFVVSSKKGGFISQETFNTVQPLILKYQDDKERIKKINEEVSKISKDLQVTFIPRTLYELIFVSKVIKSDKIEIEVNKGKAFYEKEVVIGFSQKSFKDIKPAPLAFKVNNLIVKELKLCKKPILTFEKISKHTKEKIEEFVKVYEDRPKKIDTRNYTLREYFELPGRTNGCDGIAFLDERRKNIVRNMVALECSEEAKNAYIICRGASDFLFFDTTLPKDTLVSKNNIISVSFGTSLFAGIVNGENRTSTVFTYQASYESDSYAVFVPKSDTSPPFYIPKENAVEQFLGSGEAFHARTKAAKGENILTSTGCIAGVNIREAQDKIKSEFTREELHQKFTQYKRSAIFLAAPKY